MKFKRIGNAWVKPEDIMHVEVRKLWNGDSACKYTVNILTVQEIIHQLCEPLANEENAIDEAAAFIDELETGQ